MRWAKEENIVQQVDPPVRKNSVGKLKDRGRAPVLAKMARSKTSSGSEIGVFDMYPNGDVILNRLETTKQLAFSTISSAGPDVREDLGPKATVWAGMVLRRRSPAVRCTIAQGACPRPTDFHRCRLKLKMVMAGSHASLLDFQPTSGGAIRDAKPRFPAELGNAPRSAAQQPTSVTLLLTTGKAFLLLQPICYFNGYNGTSILSRGAAYEKTATCPYTSTTV